jgi:hypothetical protein
MICGNLKRERTQPGVRLKRERNAQMRMKRSYTFDPSRYQTQAAQLAAENDTPPVKIQADISRSQL